MINFTSQANNSELFNDFVKKQNSASNVQVPAPNISDEFVKEEKPKTDATQQNTGTQDNKSKIARMREWLEAPVDNPKFNSNIRPKVSRFDKYFSNLLSVAWIVLFAWYINKITGGILKGKATFSPKDVWQDINSAPMLKDLALPKQLEDLTHSLIKKIDNPKEHIAKGGTFSNTILLWGPPGTGKTTYAKAIAKQFENSKFASIDLGTIQDKYVGETEKRLNSAVNEICRVASENPKQRVFVLFDEIDSFAIKDNGSHNQQYQASTLNTLKKAITEKLFAYDNVTTIAATNVDIYPDEKIGEDFSQKLSSTITDRFGTKIKVDNPTQAQFQKAIASHYQKASHAAEYLKNENSPEVQEIARELVKKNGSFRTLESVYDRAASSCDKEVLGMDDIRKALKDAKGAEKKFEETPIRGFARFLDEISADAGQENQIGIVQN